MYVTQFELADLRCFRGVHRVSLDRGDGSYAGWTVFAGRNGTGKSTLLHLLGINHLKLTYRHLGRDFRLTDLGGEVVHKLLA